MIVDVEDDDDEDDDDDDEEGPVLVEGEEEGDDDDDEEVRVGFNCLLHLYLISRLFGYCLFRCV